MISMAISTRLASFMVIGRKNILAISLVQPLINTMKKQNPKAKSNRQVEEKDADAIGMGLYELLCTWAVQSASLAGIMVWAFLVTQWNVMGRTVNVDPLGFHNIRKSQHDSIVVEYDYNKADQTGEKTTPKNVYRTELIGRYLKILTSQDVICMLHGRHGWLDILSIDLGEEAMERYTLHQ
jgi:hypothetical protein